jgi:hypothetical protein
MPSRMRRLGYLCRVPATAASLALGSLACAAPHVSPSFTPPVTHTLALRIVDHLSFGARLESVAVLLDGSKASPSRDTSQRVIDELYVSPGTHTLTIEATVSEPCGLFSEPRATIAARTQTNFTVGERPAFLDIDLYPREANRDPLGSLGVRFRGSQLAFEVPDDAPQNCEKGDTVCGLEERASRALRQGARVRAACFESRVAEARQLRETLDDSYAAVNREGKTTQVVEEAQLRARYAQARLESLPADAEACAASELPAVRTGAIERRVEHACPALDVTAALDPTPLR